MSEQLALSAIMALPPQVVDEFDTWWPIYPRKDDKKAARAAFIRARRKATLEQLSLGVLRYEFSSDPRFVPLAATWLNKERWRVTEGPDLALDPWGLSAWLAALPSKSPSAMFHPSGYDIEALAEILQAAGLVETWRGDLGWLDRWLCDGYRPDSISEVVAETAPGVSGVVRSLGVFDRAVRRRAARWHAARQEWVRGA